MLTGWPLLLASSIVSKLFFFDFLFSFDVFSASLFTPHPSAELISFQIFDSPNVAPFSRIIYSENQCRSALDEFIRCKISRNSAACLAKDVQYFISFSSDDNIRLFDLFASTNVANNSFDNIFKGRANQFTHPVVKVGRNDHLNVYAMLAFTHDVCAIGLHIQSVESQEFSDRVEVRYSLRLQCDTVGHECLARSIRKIENPSF